MSPSFDGDLRRAHPAALDGDVERPISRRAGRSPGAQQEEQPAQDEHDDQDHDRRSCQLRPPPCRRIFIFVTIPARL